MELHILNHDTRRGSLQYVMDANNTAMNAGHQRSKSQNSSPIKRGVFDQSGVSAENCSLNSTPSPSKISPQKNNLDKKSLILSVDTSSPSTAGIKGVNRKRLSLNHSNDLVESLNSSNLSNSKKVRNGNATNEEALLLQQAPPITLPVKEETSAVINQPSSSATVYPIPRDDEATTQLKKNKETQPLLLPSEKTNNPTPTVNETKLNTANITNAKAITTTTKAKPKSSAKSVVAPSPYVFQVLVLGNQNDSSTQFISSFMNSKTPKDDGVCMSQVIALPDGAHCCVRVSNIRRIKSLTREKLCGEKTAVIVVIDCSYVADEIRQAVIWRQELEVAYSFLGMANDVPPVVLAICADLKSNNDDHEFALELARKNNFKDALIVSCINKTNVNEAFVRAVTLRKEKQFSPAAVAASSNPVTVEKKTEAKTTQSTTTTTLRETAPKPNKKCVIF